MNYDVIHVHRFKNAFNIHTHKRKKHSFVYMLQLGIYRSVDGLSPENCDVVECVRRYRDTLSEILTEFSGNVLNVLHEM